MENNRQIKLYSSGCTENNNQMNLYSPGCMENNKQMELYSMGVWKIRENGAVLPWVYGK
jgi:hypothetical protein